MREYLNLLRDVLENGVDRPGRNGDTRALFSVPVRFNLDDGFPAVTTKKLAFKTMAAELLWFLEGSGDDNRLKEITGRNRTIWTDNAESAYWSPKSRFPGDLGRIYGVQWRRWENRNGQVIDQISDLIDGLRNKPFDRRHVVTAWNPGELGEMALPPCHMLFQLFAYPDGRLSLSMVQRSCDLFLGVPFNIASYALLLSMIAQVVGMRPYECVFLFQDAHIYHAHFDAVLEQLSRDPLERPKLWLNPDIKEIDDFKMEDIELRGYEHHPAIEAPMIV